MPYCVKCGVELGDSADRCPLCNTPVLLPEDMLRDKADDKAHALYPDRLQQSGKPRLNLVTGKPVVLLASFLLAIPFLITLLVDIKGNGGITWSFYPMMSLVLLWLMLAYPALLRRHTIAVAFTVDALATSAFLISLDYYADGVLSWSWYPALALILVWLFGLLPVWLSGCPLILAIAYFILTAGFLWALEQLTRSGPWFFPLALPLAGAVSVFGLGVWIAIRFLKGPLLTAALITLLTTLLMVAVEGLTQRFISGRVLLAWSPVTAAIGIPLSAYLWVLHGNADMRAFLQKKFHI